MAERHKLSLKEKLPIIALIVSGIVLGLLLYIVLVPLLEGNAVDLTTPFFFPEVLLAILALLALLWTLMGTLLIVFPLNNQLAGLPCLTLGITALWFLSIIIIFLLAIHVAPAYIWVSGSLCSLFLTAVAWISMRGGLRALSRPQTPRASRVVSLMVSFLVFTILFGQLALVPAKIKEEGLRFGGTPYFAYPEIKASGDPVEVKVDTNPLKVIVSGDAELEIVEENIVRLSSSSTRLRIELEEREGIYGLTERNTDSVYLSEICPQELGELNLRGQRVHMWTSPTSALYSPFYLSSRGYGMFVEGSLPGVYDIGVTMKDAILVEWESPPGKGFSCIFFGGENPLSILDKYTFYTGRPILPPSWAFKHYFWRGLYEVKEPSTAQGVPLNPNLLEDLEWYDKLGLPPGVIVFDRPWATGPYGYGSLDWDLKRFPNPELMLEKLKEKGWQILVWGAPWVLGETKEEATKSGYLAPESDRLLDYTNPGAVGWHQEKIVQFLKRYPEISGWKLDRAEEFTPSGRRQVWFDGRSGFEVHNDYLALTVETFYEATRAVRGDDFLLLSRFSYGRDKSYAVFWGGDAPGSTFFGSGPGTDLGLRNSIIALLRASCMGYPYWGSDTGGYYPFKDREVFARWIEFSSMCPIMEIGGIGSHRPWDINGVYDGELVEIYCKYVNLHHSLVDYTYGLAKRAHETGNPIVHPLFFDFPQDGRAREIWDEYMYGPRYLIAPMWKSGQREREVYLPQGKWADFWNQEMAYEGPITIPYHAELDTLPIFEKLEETQMTP